MHCASATPGSATSPLLCAVGSKVIQEGDIGDKFYVIKEVRGARAGSLVGRVAGGPALSSPAAPPRTRAWLKSKS